MKSNLQPSLSRPALAALLTAAFVLLGSAQSTSEATQDSSDSAPAYHLDAGSIARSRVVAVGRDMVIDGEAKSHAVVLSGDLRLAGSVNGDVIVLGGDAKLSSSARVGGDVFVLGGHIETAEGATIDGRSVAYPQASDLWVTLIQGPTLELSAFSPVVLGAKLALLAFWGVVLLLLMGIGQRGLVSTSESIRQEPFRNFLVGLTGVSAMVLTTMFFSVFAGAMVGIPLLVLLAVIALVLRFWGMVAVFHALGEGIGHYLQQRRQRRTRWLPLKAATFGLIALGLLKFLPWVGIWAWTVATFIGVGAALTTKLGRREAWFESY